MKARNRSAAAPVRGLALLSAASLLLVSIAAPAFADLAGPDEDAEEPVETADVEASTEIETEPTTDSGPPETEEPAAEEEAPVEVQTDEAIEEEPEIQVESQRGQPEGVTCSSIGYPSNMTTKQSGDWGSTTFTPDSGALQLTVNEGWTVDVCINKGSGVGSDPFGGAVDLGEYTEGSYNIWHPNDSNEEGSSHYSLIPKEIPIVEPGEGFLRVFKTVLDSEGGDGGEFAGAEFEFTVACDDGFESDPKTIEDGGQFDVGPFEAGTTCTITELDSQGAEVSWSAGAASGFGDTAVVEVPVSTVEGPFEVTFQNFFELDNGEPVTIDLEKLWFDAAGGSISEPAGIEYTISFLGGPDGADLGAPPYEFEMGEEYTVLENIEEGGGFEAVACESVGVDLAGYVAWNTSLIIQDSFDAIEDGVHLVCNQEVDDGTINFTLIKEWYDAEGESILQPPGEEFTIDVVVGADDEVVLTLTEGDEGEVSGTVDLLVDEEDGSLQPFRYGIDEDMGGDDFAAVSCGGLTTRDFTNQGLTINGPFQSFVEDGEFEDVVHLVCNQEIPDENGNGPPPPPPPPEDDPLSLVLVKDWRVSDVDGLWDEDTASSILTIDGVDYVSPVDVEDGDRIRLGERNVKLPDGCVLEGAIGTGMYTVDPDHANEDDVITRTITNLVVCEAEVEVAPIVVEPPEPVTEPEPEPDPTPEPEPAPTPEPEPVDIVDAVEVEEVEVLGVTEEREPLPITGAQIGALTLLALAMLLFGGTAVTWSLRRGRL